MNVHGVDFSRQGVFLVGNPTHTLHSIRTGLGGVDTMVLLRCRRKAGIAFLF